MSLGLPATNRLAGDKHPGQADVSIRLLSAAPKDLEVEELFPLRALTPDRYYVVAREADAARDEVVAFRHWILREFSQTG